MRRLALFLAGYVAALITVYVGIFVAGYRYLTSPRRSL